MRPAHDFQHLPLHVFNALRRVDLVQAAQPAVIRRQRRGLLLVRLQPRADNLFPVIRPLLQLAAIVVATQIAFRPALVNILNLPAPFAHAPAGDPLQQQRRIDDKMHHQRRLVAVLPQQNR